jgi:hypothetical protein
VYEFVCDDDARALELIEFLKRALIRVEEKQSKPRRKFYLESSEQPQ